MKKLGFFGKIIFFFNSIFAVFLLLGYLLPCIPPRLFPALSVLSLFLPILFITNIFFFVYWLFRTRRQFLLSGFVLALGFFHIVTLYRFGDVKENDSSDISVLSFNVRGFKGSDSSQEINVPDEIHAFIYRENPDVVCFQEFNAKYPLDAEIYPYNNRDVTRAKNRGQIIYSKYPILESASLEFENSYNNGVYVDIVVKKDTVRVYNIHFQSLRILPRFDELQQEETKSLISRIGNAFKMQEDQMHKFLASEARSPYPVIVAGDFNNSATSYLYRKVKGEKKDAFAKAGSGTGATYTFDFIPLRIDFILADKGIEVVHFKSYNVSLSDHQPIMSSFNIE